MDPVTDMLARFLTLVEERKLDQASAYLAEGARMVFPGGTTHSSLAELAESAKTRYRWVRKRIERWDVLATDEDEATVYCLGTLYGEALDGTPFSGIRFLDRFEVRKGRIVLQEVWNDLAEHGIVGPKGMSRQAPADAAPRG